MYILALTHCLQLADGYRFLPQHPQHQSHAMLEVNEPHLCHFITNGDFPRKDVLENREVYAQTVLAVFRNWRTEEDMRGEFSSWIDGLEAWLTGARPPPPAAWVLRFLDNIHSMRKANDEMQKESELHEQEQLEQELELRSDASAQHLVQLGADEEQIDEVHSYCIYTYLV